MSSFREVLELFVRADVQGAVTNLNRLGVEAERNLDKGTQASERLANRFVYTGAAMVGTAAVLGYGLYQLAGRFSEAERAGLLMDNTIEKMPELAGASRQAFDDLASSIMKKTAVDDDAILTAEALLGTFHLTSDEIKKATPLVVDYARKFGVDLNSAAIQVGKAFEGNIGTLQRNGIVIDANRYATDRFGAVIQALRENAGGFAEAEGATFEGRLARVKNELGNLGEAAGGGVVNALDGMLGAVEPLVAGLGDLDEATGGAVGQVATWTTIAIGAVGGTLALAGGVMKLKNYVGELGEAFPRVSGQIGSIASTAGPAVGGIAALTVGVYTASHALAEMTHSAADFDVSADALENHSGRLDRQLRNLADSLSGLRDSMDDVDARHAADLQKAYGNEIETVTDKVRNLAAESPTLARQFVDQAEKAGLSEAVVRRLRDTIEDEINVQKKISDARQADIDILKGQIEATDEAVAAINNQIDAQQRQLSTELQALDANDKYRQALDEYAAKARVAAEAGGDNALANADASLAMRDAESSALRLATANAADAEAKAKAAGVTDTAAVKNQAFRDTLVYLAGTLEPGSDLQKYLQDAINRLDAAGKDRHATITANGQQAVDEADRVATAWERTAGRIRVAFSGVTIDPSVGLPNGFLNGRE